MTLHNLLVYNLQVLLLVAVCGALIAGLRIPSPKVRLVMLQALLGACLLLPFLEPRVEIAGRVTAMTRDAFALSPSPSAGARFTLPSNTELVFIVLISGVAIRLAFLGLGLIRLLRYRRDASLKPLAHLDLQKRLGIAASFYVSEDVTGPVTVGFGYPAILLPPVCLDSDFIACHELIHVRRRDWIAAFAEQIVLALFWFHPAVWWLAARIQLVREQVVDREVVALFESRERYLDTLLEAASRQSMPDLAPAIPFLQKRHLRERVAPLLQEVHTMSRFRLFSSATALAAAAFVTIFVFARALPLQAAQGNEESSGIEVKDTGPFKLLHRVPVEYPREAFDKHIEGGVVVQVTLNGKGEVADAKIISGPEELRAAVLSSVLQWHFVKDPNQVSQFEIAVNFKLPAALADRFGQLDPWPPGEAARTLNRVDLSGVPEALRAELSSAINVREGQAITRDDAVSVSAAARKLDEHMVLRIQPGDNGAVNLAFAMQDPSAKPPMRIRVGAPVSQANLIHKVTPVYPMEAKQARVQGIVKLQALIGKDGAVQDLQLMEGPPELVQASLDSVRQWVYRPTLLNGEPVEVVTTIEVNYTLSK